MSTAGPRYPGTGGDDATVGTRTWSDTNQLAADDASYANLNFNANASEQSHYLTATNFGFTIPEGDIIDGITIEWEHYADYDNQAGPTYTYASVAGVVGIKAGAIAGSFSGPSNPTTSPAVVSAGGSSQLGGTTWTAAQINASNFGVGISYSNYDDASTNNNIHVDFVRITITHHTPSGGTKFTGKFAGKLTGKMG